MFVNGAYLVCNELDLVDVGGLVGGELGVEGGHRLLGEHGPPLPPFDLGSTILG